MNWLQRRITLYLILAPLTLFAESFLQMDTLLTYPAQIHNQFGKKVEHVFYVDFNGDEIKDYIVEIKTNHPSKYHEVWLTDKFEPYLQKVNDRLEFDYRFFINLDDDPEPELITARGTSKGINYALIDLVAKQEQLVCYFNPVVKSKSGNTFGYPWDLTGIDVKRMRRDRGLEWVINHNIEREGEYIKPESPRPFPVLFLEGRPSSVPIRDSELGKSEILSIEEVKMIRIKKK